MLLLSRNIISLQRGGCFSTTSFARFFSSTNTDLVLTQIDDEKGIATVTMNRKPANSLSFEMSQAISNAIKTIEKEHSTIHSMILCSSSKSIFCAGLDLTEIYNPSSDEVLINFWQSIQQLYMDLYGSRLSTFAAIQGHAPAAGCMLAMSCDYRIMTNNEALTIGLNEAQFGLVPPPWMGQQYIDILGHRRAELSMSIGTLFQPMDALQIGLVDQLEEEEEGGGGGGGGAVMEAAVKEAIKWNRIPHMSRYGTKLLTRQKQIDYFLKNRQADTDQFVKFVTMESTQKNLGQYLQMISSRGKKKAK